MTKPASIASATGLALICVGVVLAFLDRFEITILIAGVVVLVVGLAGLDRLSSLEFGGKGGKVTWAERKSDIDTALGRATPGPSTYWTPEALEAIRAAYEADTRAKYHEEIARLERLVAEGKANVRDVKDIARQEIRDHERRRRARSTYGTGSTLHRMGDDY